MPQEDLHTHGHEFAELVIILSGEALHTTGAARHRVQAGDVLFINSSRSHAYTETNNLVLANILLRDDQLLRELARDFGALPGYHALFTLERMRWRQREFTSHLRLRHAELRQVIAWLDALKEETAQSAATGSRLLARCWLVLIIGYLARRYGRDAAESPRLEMRLSRVLSQGSIKISSTPPASATLARRAAMSERTFLRRFREATGCSPADYLIRTRIRHAAKLLERGNTSITSVAFHCGFEDSNYFTRQFRKVTGKTATQDDWES